MTRQLRLGTLLALGLLVPSLLDGAPSRVVIRRDPGSRPAPRPSDLGPALQAVPGAHTLRYFPHDLRRENSARRSPRTLSDLRSAPREAQGQTAHSGDLRLAVLRVDFLRDGAGNQSTGNGRFDLRRGVSGIPVDPPPHDKAYFEAHGEALRRYYGVQSYGSLRIVPTVFPSDPDSAFHLEDTADYGPWEVSQNPDVVALAERFVTDALAAVDAHPENVPFADFDAFVVVHAGTDFQGDVDRNTPFDIPSFTINLADSIEVDGGAARVGRVLVLPETASQDDRIAALNGVFAHEFGHVLDLVDLYNIFNGVSQVGYWSLMDSGENIAAIVADPETGDEFIADGIFPTSLDPWSKLQIFPDVFLPLIVEERWDGDLDAVELNPEFPLVLADGLEYFLVENRALDLDGNGFPFVQQDSTTGVFLGPVDDPDNPGGGGSAEYDAVLPQGGILIWHIDDRLAVPGFETGAVNFYPWERGVSVEEADGITDLGLYSSPFDAWYVGNHSRFAPDTTPSSATNYGAYTGIVIETTSPPGPEMAVHIERDLALTIWPLVFSQSADVQRRGGSLTLADLSGDGTPEIVFALEATVTGLPQTVRSLVKLELDGAPYADTVFVDLGARLRSGLAASDSFVTASGALPRTVVAGTVANGQVFLWDADGNDLLDDRGRVNAALAPVLWPPAGAPGKVLSTGVGTFLVLDPAGPAGDRIDVSRAAPASIPSAGPTLLPGVTWNGDEVDLAAVAYEGGVVECFSPEPEVPASGFPIFRLPTTVRALLSGWVAPEDADPSLVAATADSIYVLRPGSGSVRAGWAIPGSLALPPILGDLDGDARAEILAADSTGRIHAMNGDGSPVLGWPRAIPAPVEDLKILDLDGDGGADVAALDGLGRFWAWSGSGELLERFPRALGRFEIKEALVARFDRSDVLAPGALPVEILWLASVGEAALAAIELGKDSDLATETGEWIAPGGGRGRGYLLPQPNAPAPAVDAPILAQPLFAYPNPARDWVELRFLLEDGEAAALEVLDLAGRALESPRLESRGGYRPGENAVRWELSGVPPGLFLCRLERSGPKGTRVDFARVVVLR